MGDERFSVSRAVPAVTVEVAGKAVTYQEVAVVSLSEFECAAASPKPVAAVLMMTATAVLVAVVAVPAPLLPQAVCGAAQPSLWFEASEGPLAGGKAPSGDEVDTVDILSPKDCGTNDESDGTGVTEGGIFL